MYKIILFVLLLTFSHAVAEQVPIPRGDGISVTVGQQWDAVESNLTDLDGRVAEIELNGGGGTGGVSSYEDLTDKPVLGTAAPRNATNTLTFSEDLVTGSAILNYVGSASTRDAEDSLTNGPNLTSGLAVKNHVESVAALKDTSNIFTEPQTFQTGITTSSVGTTAPDGSRYGNFLNTVAFSGITGPGVCQYSTYLDPIGWYCHNGTSWIFQGSQGYTDLATDYGVNAAVETFLQNSTRASLEAAIGGPLGMTTFMDLTDRPATITLAQLERLAGSTQNIQTQIQNLQDQIDALTSNPVAPILTSATIGTTGNSITLASNSNLTVGAGSSVFDVDCTLSGTNITATLLNGLGTPNLTYTLGSTVQKFDTCNLDHVQSGNGVEKASDGTDLATFSDMAITNNSLYEEGGTAGLIFDMDFEDIQSVDLSGWTIDQPGGVLTADYTVAISGLESLYMKNNGGSYNSIWSPSFGPYSELYYSFSLESTSTTGLALHGPGFYSAGTLVGRLQTDGTAYKPSHGSVIGDSVVTRSANTRYYTCGKITISTSGAGIHSVNVGISATPSENNTVLINTGNATGLIDQVRIGQLGSTGLVFDDFILQTDPIAICTGAGL